MCIPHVVNPFIHQCVLLFSLSSYCIQINVLKRHIIQLTNKTTEGLGPGPCKGLLPGERRIHHRLQWSCGSAVTKLRFELWPVSLTSFLLSSKGALESEVVLHRSHALCNSIPLLWASCLGYPSSYLPEYWLTVWCLSLLVIGLQSYTGPEWPAPASIFPLSLLF